jgi:SAM-dependent methyltransferase
MALATGQNWPCGARVIASDLTPRLLEAGRARHADALEWVCADAEQLPFLDADFDVVLSCIGVMFSPFHERSAAEMLRVCRPGGRIGLLAWTAEGFVGTMLAAMRPYAAPVPPGASSPLAWGDPTHVAGLFGEGVTALRARRAGLRVALFADQPISAFRSYFKQRYGPTIATYQRLARRPDDIAALDADLDALAAAHRDSEGVMTWEYLVVTAVRTSAPAI